MENHDGAGKDIVDGIIETLEQQTGTKIFTMKVLDTKEDEQSLDVVVVFEDKAVLMGTVHVQTIDGKLGVRVQANYV